MSDRTRIYRGRRDALPRRLQELNLPLWARRVLNAVRRDGGLRKPEPRF